MKKLFHRTSGLVHAVLTALLLVLVSACSPSEPSPTPPNPGGEDPTPVIPPQKEWLKFNDAGELAELPIPFVGFGEAPEAAKKWESAWGSTLATEKETGSNLELCFDTNTTRGRNFHRIYSFETQKLIQSAYDLDAKLLFDANSSTPVLNSHFSELLSRAGYTRVEDANADKICFSNGNLSFYFAYSKEDPTLALVEVILKKEDTVSKWDLKDFPFMSKSKEIKDFSEDEIRKHEANVGRHYSEEQSQANVTLAFNDPENKTNFSLVKYDRKDGVESDGTPRKAQIVMRSENIASIDLLDSPEGESYLLKNGFKFQKILDSGQLKARVYKAEELGYSLTVADDFGGNGGTIWVLDNVEVGGGSDPGTDPDERPAYYLPIYAWDAPITEDSPIITMEKERGFTATFSPAEEEDEFGFPKPASIDSEPPYDKDYSLSVAKKLGVYAFSYEINKYSDDPVHNVKASMYLNYSMKTDKQKEGFEGLVKFLESEGFVLMKGGQYKDQITHFYNSTDKVLVEINYFMGSLMVTFTYEESYE